PYDLFRELRAATPVHWNAMPGDAGVWAITRYKDVFDVSLDQKTFSSQRSGAILRTMEADGNEVQKGLLINMDPPGHTKHRRLVSAGFAGKVIRNLEHDVRRVTTE